jgi:hypothetical protein
MQITSAASALRVALAQYPDENSSELAYALGVVGQIDDARLILVEAEKGVSVITQRRCLLGMARLFGVEQAFYRLILLDDMTRDSALLEMIKGSDSVMRAFEIYMQGDETSALDRLASSVSHAGLSMLAERPVKDAFLLAVCIVAKP